MMIYRAKDGTGKHIKRRRKTVRVFPLSAGVA